MSRAIRVSVISLAALLIGAATAQAAGTLTVKKNQARFGTVTSGDGLISCNPFCEQDSQFYDDPAEVTLTATPRPDGFAFVDWTGCDSPTDNVCEQVVDNPEEEVTANFEDIEDPTVDFGPDSPADGALVSGEVPFDADTSDNDVVGSVHFTFNATTVVDTQPPFEFTVDSATSPLLVEGSNTITLQSFDFSSRGSPEVERTITVDNPPRVTIFGPSGTITDTTPQFTFIASEPSTFECRLDTPSTNPGFTPCTSPQGYAPLADGSYRFEVRATDGTDNQGIAGRNFTVDTVDRTPPNTTITKAPKRKSKKRKAKFRFEANEPGATFECKLDRKRWRSCSSPFKKRVKRGKHKFKVRAIDRSGNVDPTPAKRKFKVKRRR